MSLDDHPSFRRARATARLPVDVQPLSAEWLKALALRHGAEDVGLVEVGRAELAHQLSYIRQVYPQTRTLLSFVVRMNREAVRSQVRSVANQDFHAVYDEVTEAARAIVRALDEAGVPACNAVAAFPMEVQASDRGWMLDHKPVAVAAGLGKIGVHRSVIHPKFGSFVLLGAVLIGAEADAYDQPIDYDPCQGCKLCVAACPVGALKPDGGFDFITCYTHDYRELLGNVSDFVGAVVESKDMKTYRDGFSDGETTPMWQSLSFKPGYKPPYCIAVCPAGEDMINPFLEDRPGYMERVLKPLTDRRENLYILPGSDAENYAADRFLHKTVKRVGRTLRTTSINSFLAQVPLAFQRGRSKGLAAAYHWTFTGQEEAKATIRIENQKIVVQAGHRGEAQVKVTADAKTWVDIMNREYGLLTAIVLRKVRVKGEMALFRAFGRCFPG